MKKTIFSFLLVLLAFVAPLISQSAPGEVVFTGKCTVQQTGGGTGFWTVLITQFVDPHGIYDATDIDEDDYVVFSDAGIIYELQIIEVVSAVGNTATVKVSNSGITGIAGVATNPNSFVSTRTLNLGLTPWVADLTALENQMQLENMVYKIDAAFANISDAAFYSSSDLATFSPSSPTPNQGDFAFWQNRGQLLENTGSWAWRSSKNGELVNGDNIIDVTWVPGDSTTFNLNLGNRFRCEIEETLILKVSNLASAQVGDIFVFEIVMIESEGVQVQFPPIYFNSFELLGAIPTQWLLQESTRIFTFKVLEEGGRKYLASCDDLSAGVYLVKDGLYNPTLYNFSTDTIKAIYPHFYEIGDSIITVTGKFRVNSTAGTVATSVQIQMPPGGASNFTSSNNDVNGQVFAATRSLPFTNYYGFAFGNTATDRMEVSFKADENASTEQYVEYIIKYVKK